MSENLAVANFHRAAAAGIADAEIADRFLRLPPLPYPVIWQAVARARLADPTASWAELGARLGMSKNRASGIGRRIRLAVLQQPPAATPPPFPAPLPIR